MARARPCAPPTDGLLLASLPGADYVDAFEIDALKTQSPTACFAAIFGHLPGAFRTLLQIRNRLVAPLGIRGASPEALSATIDPTLEYGEGDRIGRWRLYAQTEDELITGDNDKHLDFRVSLLRRGERLIASTAVHTHNAFGRAYLATILPFHRRGVVTLLNNASRAGRL